MSREITDRLKTAGYKMEAELHHDNFDGRDGQSVWDIKITRNGREHCMQFHQAVVARRFKNGSLLKFQHLSPPMTIAQLEANQTTKPLRPTYADVFYVWLSDSRCVSDGQSFEEFCDEFGYDSDSRRALACYNGCKDQLLGALRLGVDFDEFDILFEDY